MNSKNMVCRSINIKGTIKLNLIATLFLTFVSTLLAYGYTYSIIYFYGDALNGLFRLGISIINYLGIADGGLAIFIISILYKPIREKKWDIVSKIMTKTKRVFYTSGIFYVLIAILLSLLVPLTVNSNSNFSYFFMLSLFFSTCLQFFISFIFTQKYNILWDSINKKYISTFIISIVNMLSYSFAIFFLFSLKGKIYIDHGVRVLDPSSSHLKWNIVYVSIIPTLAQVFGWIFNKLYVKKALPQISFNYTGQTKNKKINNLNLYKKFLSGIVLKLSIVILFSTDEIVLAISSWTNSGNNNYTNHILQLISIYTIYWGIINSIRLFLDQSFRSVQAKMGLLKSESKKREIVELLNKYSIYLSIIIIVPISVILPYFVQLFFGHKDVKDYFNLNISVIACICLIIYNIRASFIIYYENKGSWRGLVIPYIIEALINIIISIALVWNLGVIGVSIGTLVAYTFRAFYSYILFYKKNYARMFAKNILPFLSLVISITLISLEIIILPHAKHINYSTNSIYIAFFVVFIIIPIAFLFLEYFYNNKRNFLKKWIIK